MSLSPISRLLSVLNFFFPVFTALHYIKSFRSYLYFFDTISLTHCWSLRERLVQELKSIFSFFPLHLCCHVPWTQSNPYHKQLKKWLHHVKMVANLWRQSKAVLKHYSVIILFNPLRLSLLCQDKCLPLTLPTGSSIYTSITPSDSALILLPKAVYWQCYSDLPPHGRAAWMSG